MPSLLSFLPIQSLLFQTKLSCLLPFKSWHTTLPTLKLSITMTLSMSFKRVIITISLLIPFFSMTKSTYMPTKTTILSILPNRQFTQIQMTSYTTQVVQKFTYKTSSSSSCRHTIIKTSLNEPYLTKPLTHNPLTNHTSPVTYKLYHTFSTNLNN